MFSTIECCPSAGLQLKAGLAVIQKSCDFVYNGNKNISEIHVLFKIGQKKKQNIKCGKKLQF